MICLKRDRLKQSKARLQTISTNWCLLCLPLDTPVSVGAVAKFIGLGVIQSALIWQVSMVLII